MRIVYDAKRYYHNRRGLGNYSRDVVRLVQTYSPETPIELLDRSGLSRMMPVGLTKGETAIYHGLSGEIPIEMPKGWKTIVTMHDCIYMRYPELYSPSYRWFFRKKVQYASDHADIVLCISEQTKEDMITYFGTDEKKIRVVYQGCNNIFREPCEARVLDKPYILQVGAIEPRKNLKATIRAVSMLHESLCIVALGGHTNYADECAALAKELGVDLRMLHNEPFATFPSWYKGAEMSVYPSFFEGFGIPILESMCVGTPVITSTGSCFHEVGGDAALYASPEQPEELADCIRRVLNDKACRQTMSERGYAQAERFRDEEVVKNLLQVYHELDKQQ